MPLIDPRRQQGGALQVHHLAITVGAPRFTVIRLPQLGDGNISGNFLPRGVELAEPAGSADGERQLIIEFGRRLREARRRACLSQAEVAKRLGIKQGYVSRVELGMENITLLACARYAQAVGCLDGVYAAAKAA